MKRLLIILCVILTVFSSLSVGASVEEYSPKEFTSKDGSYRYTVVNDEGVKYAVFDKLVKKNAKTFTMPDELGGEVVIFVSVKAFENCKKLKKVKLGKYVRTIGDKAFKNCSSLEKINLNVITDFGEDSFSGCSSLKSIDLTKGSDRALVQVRERAFYNCKKLKTVKIYDEANISEKAFGYDSAGKKVAGFKMKLSTDDSDGDNEYTKNGLEYCRKNGFKCIYNLNSRDKKKLYLMVGFKGELRVNSKKLSKWKSSNKKVLKLDAKGSFVALKKGKAVLTAKKANGKKYRRSVSIIKE